MNFINQKGVSLPELLIAVAIMGVMSLVFFPNYTSYKKNKSMELARVQIIGDIRKIQNYALSTVEFSPGNFPQNGYGIHFDTSSPNNDKYIIFADLSGGTDRIYDAGEDYQVIELPEGVTIAALSVGTETPSEVDYLASPPYGVIYINDQNKISDSVVTMEITYTNGIVTDSITLKSSGYIN